MLALLGSGEKKYRSHVEKAARAFAAATRGEDERPGHLCWKYTLFGIALAEYHLATGAAWVLPELGEIDRWLRSAQAPPGGFGHRQWRSDGSNGYGPICMITAQALLAWDLIERCGIAIDQKRRDAAQAFLARGTNEIGYVWYKDSSGGKGYADMGRTGGSALAHALARRGDETWLAAARRNAACIGKHWKTFPDTHGSPILGMVWTALGAAVDPRALRSLLDHNRWFFALSRCPDGTFVYQPNRDGNAQDWAAAPRLSATAAFALIFALKDRKLAITGGATR
jgi:hypothetical protein